MKRSALLWPALAIVTLVAAGYFLIPSGPSTDATKKARQRAGGPVPVVVTTAKREAVPVTVRAVGNAQANATVTVKSRVDGQIMEIHFKDGQTVRKGDLLYTIDPRPFQAQINQATSVLARDRAQLENARVNLKRAEELHSKGYTAQQQLDLARTTVAALEETIKADEATIEGARLQLDYTAIRAPFDGRAADTQVDAGNLVKANDVALVVINQTKPIDVAFSVPEQFAFEIRQRMTKESLAVEVSAPNTKGASHTGTVTFINNAIDSTTGTVLVKATLPNDDESLLPGQFVTVMLRLMTIPDAVVVPSQAVQTGQKGEYVYLVTPDKTAALQPVEVGESTGPNVVIRKGLEGGEQVVTDGQLRLVPGARVAPAGSAGMSKDASR